MIIMDICPSQQRTKSRFIFDSRWARHEEVEEVIKESWQYQPQGYRMFKVHRKLMNCRKELIKWRKSNLTNSRSHIEELQKEIERGKELGEIENGKGGERHKESWKRLMKQRKNIGVKGLE